MATHPTDPDRIAVVYQHRGPGAACRLNPTVRISRDGGRTWRSTKRSPAGRSGRGVSLHAAIAWGPGPDGGSRLYWANMTVPRCGDNRFSLSTTFSDDEGATWSKLRVERRTPPWVGGFPEIAVDRDPASPDYGTVYVGYNWLARGGAGPRVPPARVRGLRQDVELDGDRPGSALRAATATGGGSRIGFDLPPTAACTPPGTRSTFADGIGRGSFRRAARPTWDDSPWSIARVDFDPNAKTFDVGPSRIATTVKETGFTVGGMSAPGTDGNIRPDPMWLHGIDIDRATGQPLRGGGRIRGRDRRPTTRHDPRRPQRRRRQDLDVRGPARCARCGWPPPIEHPAEPRRGARVRPGHVPHARRRRVRGPGSAPPSPCLRMEERPGGSTESPRNVGERTTSAASSTASDFASAQSGWPTATSSGRTGTVDTHEDRQRVGWRSTERSSTSTSSRNRR